MDITSAMSTYHLNSFWNNPASTVPIVNKVDTTVKQASTPSIPLSTKVPINGLDTANLNKTSQYSAMEDGNSKPDISSILASNPSTLYKAVDLLGASQIQNLGNYLNLLI